MHAHDYSSVGPMLKLWRRPPGLLSRESCRLSLAAVSSNLIECGPISPSRNAHVRAARRPDRRIGGAENRKHGCANGGGEVGDAGIVADVERRLREPAGQFVKAVDAACTVERRVIRPSTPMDRHSALEAARQQTEFLERPVLAGAAGERMDDGETVARDVAMDARDRVGAAVRNRLHLFQAEIRGVYWRALRRQG